eukprot:gene10205-13729_t
MFLINKYVTFEALVDLFINTLLAELGYNGEMLYIIPQFKMKVHFGGGNDKESTPDLVVVDTLSYLKMVIVEDKNLSLIKFDSFPQLFAEIIPVFATSETKIEQMHKKSRIKESSINVDDFTLGVRVNGTVFHFQGVPRSQEVLHSMETLNVASAPTITIRLGDETRFDFLVKEDRSLIIYVFDKFLAHLNECGRNAQRQNSK